MRRCVIVGGADILRAEELRAYLRADDYMIFCDCGLRHAAALGRQPDLIVGDFDSYDNPHASAETIVLPREKDDTDTCFAAKEGLRRGFRDFLLLGVVGARLDHTLGNLGTALMLDGAGARVLIADDFSEMTIVSDRASVTEDFSYFSLINLDGTAGKVTVSGAKYPLREAALPCEGSLGVSNEVLPGQTARVSVGKGRALLIRIRRN